MQLYIPAALPFRRKVIKITDGTVTFEDKTVVRFNIGSGEPMIEFSGNESPVLSTYNLPLLLLPGFSSIVTAYITRLETAFEVN